MDFFNDLGNSIGTLIAEIQFWGKIVLFVGAAWIVLWIVLNIWGFISRTLGRDSRTSELKKIRKLLEQINERHANTIEASKSARLENPAEAANGSTPAIKTTKPTQADEANYPIFTYAPHYLRVRQGRGLRGLVKRWGERLALGACLRGAALHSGAVVLDTPCGPGRLFPYWQRRRWSVIGVDFSESMVKAASTECLGLGVDGSVQKGDAFNLRESELPAKPDLIACVRFLYYFDADKRIALLEHLGALTKRYVLCQYKTSETLRGQRNAGRKAYHYVSDSEIRDEIKRANLKLLRIQKISHFSDLIYVFAEKVNERE